MGFIKKKKKNTRKKMFSAPLSQSSVQPIQTIDSTTQVPSIFGGCSVHTLKNMYFVV